MSLSTDVLAKATPTRLICRGGRWTLELMRLEAVDRDVFQPRLTRLEGSESILAALRRSDDGQHLASGAAQLMRGVRDDDRAFEVEGGDWVPAADIGAPHREREKEREADTADLTRALAEVRAELSVLRASHSRLRERVMALEAAQSGIVAAARPPRGSRAQRRRSEPPPGFAEAPRAQEPLAEGAAFAATQASPGHAGPRSAPGASPPAAKPAPAPATPAATPPKKAETKPKAGPAPPLPPSIQEMARAIAGEQPLPVLSLPSLPAISECLTLLVGSTPSLESVTDVPFEQIQGGQLCKLLDDDGRERGAIILDMKAAVMLGAALLALPREEAERQLQSGSPSEDALLATSEICNNLTGPLNAVSGNTHVRSTALLALTAAEAAALPKARERLDLLVEEGRLVLAMF